MNKVMSNKKAIIIYVAPAFFLLLALIYIPIIQTGYFGMMKWTGIGVKEFIGFDNYAQLIKDTLFWKSAYHSFLLALFSTISLAGYLFISIILAGKVKGVDLLRKIYLIPMLLASVAIAQLWLKIYNPNNGILNKVLMALGVSDPPSWLADPKLALYAIIIPIIWQYAGFYILIYYAALKNIPEELIEAARIDGAKPWQIALQIKMPLIMNVIKVTIVLAVVGSLKYFDLIYVMTNGGPNGASEVMASYMYSKAFKEFDFGYASAIGFFLLVICLVVTYGIRKLTEADKEIY
ncbi:carbohydrate ABC transporter permease [Fictibacillus fluitans]|uniref:Sugar ABC transporter permease n=1 Tax=Fictibacillus fluitans TaxID=3058422 RepID=A0ABT8HY39_9BACL|nr:sugar ABC transporter permease [Fictibacillus sp. NE201]MDN4525690.1 sugar ABC transporter permease [Fictibacillus sp. NE201]